MAQLWFKFWAKEYLSDSKVRRLSYEQRGILQALWAFAWEEGSIPSDINELGNMLGLPAKAMRTHYEWITRFFIPSESDASKLVSPRLEMDRIEADAKGSKARESALQRWSKRNANASPDAMRTHEQTECDTPCVSHAGQGQKEITTPLPPAGGRQRKRRSREEITSGYPEQVRTVANAAVREWRKEDPDGRPITLDLALLVANLDLVFKSHPEATPELLISAFQAYLAKEKFRYCAPQFFFGRGKGEDPAPWVAEYRFAQHQRLREAS